jgi:hypothetical protein
MKLAAIEALIAASEREYLCADEPDDSDISLPPSGITMGMIRAARSELNSVTSQSRLLRRLGANQRSK